MFGLLVRNCGLVLTNSSTVLVLSALLGILGMKMVLRQPDLEQVMVTLLITEINLPRRTVLHATYNIGFTLDILPKQLVLNGNASLLNYDYQREKFNKAYRPDHYYTGNNPSGRSVGAKISAGSIECFFDLYWYFCRKNITWKR